MLRSSEAAPRSHPLQLLTWEAGDQMKVSLPQKIENTKNWYPMQWRRHILCSFYIIVTFGNVGVAHTCSLCGHC